MLTVIKEKHMLHYLGMRRHFFLAVKLVDKSNNQGYEVYIGDINQVFFCHGTDKATSNYLGMLFNLGYMPLIIKPTRITNHNTTLIDHIYIDVPPEG